MHDKLSDQSESNNRVVVDGNLITSQGPGTSMEFALSIVEKFFGRKKALELAKTMVFVWSLFLLCKILMRGLVFAGGHFFMLFIGYFAVV
jgi:DJ-1/PfpI family